MSFPHWFRILWSATAVWMLSGCTGSLPVKLLDVSALNTTEQEVERGAPHLTTQLHSDGLGWQVVVQQRVTAKIDTEGDEYWQYRTYDFSGQPTAVRPDNYDDVCGSFLVVTPFLAPLNVEEPPYWSRLDRMFSACEVTPVNSLRKFHEHRLLRREHRVRSEDVTEGTLQLVWVGPQQQEIVTNVLLQHNAEGRGTSVRLRWLAEELARTSAWPQASEQAHVELRLVQQNRVTLRKVLPVTGKDLVAAMGDGWVVNAPPDRWPSDLVIRIAFGQDTFPELDRAVVIHDTQKTLDQFSVAIVLREEEWKIWLADQVRFHHPEYHDAPAIDAAHAMAATLLLHVEAHEIRPTSRRLVMHIANIATGELLAALSAEGYESQWSSVVEMEMRNLHMLLRKIPNTMRPKPARVGSQSKQDARP